MNLRVIEGGGQKPTPAPSNHQISDEQVQEAAKTAPSLNDLAVRAPVCLAFYMAGVSSLSPEAGKFGAEIVSVVVNSFSRQGHFLPLSEIALFIAKLRENRQIALGLGDASEEFVARRLRNSGTMHQFALLRYVTDEIINASSFPEDEKGVLFIVIKTVIDVLDTTWDDPRP